MKTLDKILFTLAAVLVVLLMAVGWANASPAPSPTAASSGAAANVPTCDPPNNIVVLSQYNQNYMWKLQAKTNILINYDAVNGGQSVFCWEDFTNPTYGTAQIFIEVGGPHPGDCLGWDQNAGHFDVRATAPCNTSFTTGTWDLWQVSSANTFYQLFTIYNENQGNYCSWSEGLNLPIGLATCSGVSPSDHWEEIGQMIGG